MIELDHTHDPAAESWVSSAQRADTDFPIQNLPFGVFQDKDGVAQIGVAIGDSVVSLPRALRLGLLPTLNHLADICSQPHLNGFMALGRDAWRQVRYAMFELLRSGSHAAQFADALLEDIGDVHMQVPAHIGDFTDFFTSYHHARRTGEMFRPDTPLQPNFVHLPVAYHGRASSIVVSGTPCRRPAGQLGSFSNVASYTATGKLDFELEVGFYVGPGNLLGSPIGIDDAEQHVFGVCLVNDWSARDIQRWESQPLGPFLAKSFMTSVSPWIITLEALAPFRQPLPKRHSDVPAAASVLTGTDHSRTGALSIALSVSLQSQQMRQNAVPPVVISAPNFADQYWSIFQMLTHHASNGCNLRSGDLLSSGTVSGEARADSGCLLELTWNGRDALQLPGEEERTYLADHDIVTFHGQCARDGFKSIGFGVCQAEVLPAL